MPDAIVGVQRAVPTLDRGCRVYRPSSEGPEANDFYLELTRSGGEWRSKALTVHVHRQRVHTDRVGDQVQQLTPSTDRMRPTQPQRVVEMPVDALRVVPMLVDELQQTQGDSAEKLRIQIIDTWPPGVSRSSDRTQVGSHDSQPVPTEPGIR